MKNTPFTLAVLSLAGIALADQTPDYKVLVLKTRDGLAIQGYDPVAYFTDNKPANGNPKFQSEYEGAKYFFVSVEHKMLFDANPAKYAPAYGGYCGYAASIDRLSPVSPEWFQIQEGKLILQHNKKAFDLFNRELKENVAKADANWPGLVARNGVIGGKTLVYTDRKGVALGGYDAVTYFTDGQPKKGDPKIEGTFDGAVYHFVSQENRATFEKDPTKYAPAYGGFCGYAASIGKVRPADRSFGPLWMANLSFSTQGARMSCGKETSPATRQRRTSIGRYSWLQRLARKIQSTRCSANRCSTWRGLTKPKHFKN